MIFAILAYSIMTGLTALSFNWISFALLRFLVGIAIGSEWATGSSMMAELWPQNARGKGAGLMQCGLGLGFFLASFIWLFMSALGPDAWRYMFLLGILPAFLTLWIRTSIDESQIWQQVDAKRREANARKQSGATLSAADQALTRFTVADLFAEPETRRRTIIVFLMSLTTTLAWWGISSWVPPYIASVAAKAGLPGPQWASYAGMAYNVGAILGYASLGFLADRFGRKPIVMLYFALAFLMTPVLFLWTHGFDAAAGRGGGECVLHARAIFLDGGVAAGTVPDPLARNGAGVHLQRAALHRLPRAAVCRRLDRAIRRLQPRRDDDRLHLRARLRRDAVPAGNQRQAAAGVAGPPAHCRTRVAAIAGCRSSRPQQAIQATWVPDFRRDRARSSI